ncbi:flagellar biosynthetic protein FliO [Pullulanibacillus sp. KACC 23026]|uniref:flagellar biosynthetic protein FliO n=1 Tax=Pullulanibacillus sp. KACC 23026 TaxID=3028315 RepID=UPI0023B18F49|nr:flagellar biosynthetic protein FliO [Pullulanibacillus sp. KACC 23026]WEG11231.1 flagellar biosynthetic protein FliO [Pullulanibacillus sp. KACC 23026]
MKRSCVVIAILLYLFSFHSTSYAAGLVASGDPSVYETIHSDNGKTQAPSTQTADHQSSSIFPLFLKFIVSFIVVIGLLFLALRYLTKRDKSLQSSGPIISLGGQSLGNNRSLQVLLIGQTIYIIGVGDTVTLIRSVSQGEEYQNLLESYESQGDAEPPKWLPKDPKQLWESVLGKQLQKLNQNRKED